MIERCCARLPKVEDNTLRSGAELEDWLAAEKENFPQFDMSRRCISRSLMRSLLKYRSRVLTTVVVLAIAEPASRRLETSCNLAEL
jgi:hypothetical protein